MRKRSEIKTSSTHSPFSDEWRILVLIPIKVGRRGSLTNFGDASIKPRSLKNKTLNLLKN